MGPAAGKQRLAPRTGLGNPEIETFWGFVVICSQGEMISVFIFIFSLNKELVVAFSLHSNV